MKAKYFTLVADKFLKNLINNALYEDDRRKCKNLMEMMPFIPESKIIQVFQQFKGDLTLTADFLTDYSNEILSGISEPKESLQTLKKIAYDMCGLIFVDQNSISKAIFDSQITRDKILDTYFKRKISDLTFDFLDDYFEKIQEDSELPKEFKLPIPTHGWKVPNISKWNNFDNKISMESAYPKIGKNKQKIIADDLVKEKVRILYNLTRNSFEVMDTQMKSHLLQNAFELGFSITNVLLHNFSLDIDSGAMLIKVDFHALGKNEALLLFQGICEKTKELLKSNRQIKGLKIHLITGKSRKISEPYGAIASVLLKQIKLKSFNYYFENPGCIVIYF